MHGERVVLGTGILGTVALGTKARSLELLTGRVRSAEILPLDHVDHATWSADRDAVLRRVLAHPWADGALIVRSSAIGEDSATASMAGQYLTIHRVRGASELGSAVDKVFESYGAPRPGDQVLVQPQLADVRESGVACTYEPTSGAPYTVVSWSVHPDTNIVTAGLAGDLRTWYGAAYTGRCVDCPGPVGAVLALLAELRELTGEGRLDVEFAVTTAGTLVLLQVRPLVCVSDELGESAHHAVLTRVERAVAAAGRAGGLGERTAYGVMPDWNPAEMIGLRPRPLALSLYRRLITDTVWSRARHRYGYRDLRGTPLLVDVCGLPYVDVRASVTSLIPRGLPDDLATRLVETWVDRLLANPHLHDKVESRIVVSSTGLRSPGRLDGLRRAGVADRDVDRLDTALRRLTDDVLNGPLWTEDLQRVGRLRGPTPDGLLARLDFCAKYGTFPFAGLARAAFIATELLDDLVAEDVLTGEDKCCFIAGLGLVSGELSRDFHTLGRAEFLARYGHLRPGTYDIRSLRYDEDPEHYFDWSTRRTEEPCPSFRPTRAQLGRIDRLLADRGLTVGAERLLEFVGSSIRGRELAKFEFSRVLSDVLSDLRRLGETHGLTAADMSFVDVAVLGGLTGDRAHDSGVLTAAITAGREGHELTRRIALPPLLSGPQDVWSFTLSTVQPTFVTQSRVRARVADVDAGDRPDGAIAMVSSADPGYDWLFARGIAGLVTAFGGVNSHMAIRAIELGIPAVIGAGEHMFRQWSKATALDLDAANRHVAVVP